ncbi:MAG: protein kinase [Chloroflexi bacterium]|nr:protein kinase [Chloroflexota bacterium]
MVLPDPLIGRKLGDYKIVSLLGKGGMARVYKGLDEALERYAAVKVITGEFATTDEAEYTARFQREARAIARLHHPHIVSIYQFGQVEGMYYMAMVFLDGKDLRIMLKEAATRGERIPPQVILRMARDICSALDYAHGQGVIHRDIKPSNIMMTSSGAVLTDFGLALTTMEGTLGDTFGSAHYIAPEQAVSSARAVPQSDLYSFGVVLYEALTGKVPFDDPSAMTVALKHLNEEPPPPSFYNPDLPPEVEKVLLMALHKDPRQRYATCRDLYLALDVALRQTEDEDTVEISTNSGPKKTPPVAPSPQSPAALEAYLKSLRNEPHKPTTQGVQTVGDVGSNMATQPPPASRRPAFSSEAKTLTNEVVPSYRAPLPPAEEKHGSRWLWLAGMIPILLLLIGIVVVLVLTQQNDDKKDQPTQQAAVNPTDDGTPSTQPSPSQSPTADNALLTATAVFQSNQTMSAITSATATHTSTVTITPTQDAGAGNGAGSPTSTPSSTNNPTSTASATTNPTSTPTQTASATPSPTITLTTTIALTASPAVKAEIRLEYRDDRFILYNISNRVQNVGNLVFQGDTNGSFNSYDWNAAIEAAGGDIFNFASQGCVQISADQFVSGPSCRYYNAYIWRTDSDSHFWRTSGGNTTFNVLHNNQVIAECQISAGVCEFALP